MKSISNINASWPYESPLGKEQGEYLGGQKGTGKRSVSIPSSCWEAQCEKLILLSLQKKIIVDSDFFLKRIWTTWHIDEIPWFLREVLSLSVVVTINLCTILFQKYLCNLFWAWSSQVHESFFDFGSKKATFDDTEEHWPWFCWATQAFQGQSCHFSTNLYEGHKRLNC